MHGVRALARDHDRQGRALPPRQHPAARLHRQGLPRQPAHDLLCDHLLDQGLVLRPGQPLLVFSSGRMHRHGLPLPPQRHVRLGQGLQRGPPHRQEGGDDRADACVVVGRAAARRCSDGGGGTRRGRGRGRGGRGACRLAVATRREPRPCRRACVAGILAAAARPCRRDAGRWSDAGRRGLPLAGEDVAIVALHVMPRVALLVLPRRNAGRRGLAQRNQLRLPLFPGAQRPRVSRALLQPPRRLRPRPGPGVLGAGAGGTGMRLFVDERQDLPRGAQRAAAARREPRAAGNAFRSDAPAPWRRRKGGSAGRFFFFVFAVFSFSGRYAGARRAGRFFFFFVSSSERPCRSDAWNPCGSFAGRFCFSFSSSGGYEG
mmetsp:Transcript_68731/g.164002  ORF Transcript_68731/g.164002 Transcript_68731/m.164002 type:complete len:374 (+) Transcript_68731:369-1490(+)